MPSQVFSQDLITLSSPTPGLKSDRLSHSTTTTTHTNTRHGNNPSQLTTAASTMMKQLCGGGGGGTGGGHNEKIASSKIKELTDRHHLHHPNHHQTMSPSTDLVTLDHHQQQEQEEHICDIYCTECESAAKRSRPLLLSAGGDLIINSSIEHFNSSDDGTGSDWLAECRNGSGNGGGGKPKFCVNLNVPSFDIRTHRLVINVSIENKKISDDLNIINRNLSQLKQSGWFFDTLDYKEAQNLLANTERGTFLLRNSSDSRFLYSLSVQTERGPTSVRINFSNGKFQLDANPKFNDILPKDSFVVGLLENHLRTSKKSGQVWVEPNGAFYSPVVLTKPLQRHVPTLQHLSRVAVNKLQLTSAVPPGMRHYMDAYPFKI